MAELINGTLVGLMPNPPEKKPKKVDEISELEVQLAKAQKQRAADEKKASEVLARKAAAESTIKRLAAERLKKIEKIDPRLAREALITHFLMGGAAQQAGAMSVQPVGPARTGLMVGQHRIALRIADNPMVGVFAVVHPELLLGSTSQPAIDAVQEIMQLLQKYMMGFVRVTPATLSNLSQQY